MSEPVLLVESHAAVKLLRLNRPRVLNALDEALLGALLDAVEAARRDDGVHCLVLTGAGRAFSAGGDLTMMLAMQRQAFREYLRLLQRLSAAMRGLGKPILAAVNGHCLAGGFELAVSCDLRLAAETASFGLPDTALGLSPTSGMTFLLPRLVGTAWAKHLTLTGETIDARQAERIGLVTRVLADADLESAALALAERIAGYPALGLRHVKQGFDLAADVDFQTALTLELEAELACFDTEEFQANLRAFAARKRGQDPPPAG